MNKQEIGSLIKQEREGQQMLQRDLAEAAQVRRQSVLEIENGVFSYGIDRLLQLLDALGLEINIVPQKNVFDFRNVKSITKKKKK
jgi:transcriptional regulator with XRE-family HTH domain